MSTTTKTMPKASKERIERLKRMREGPVRNAPSAPVVIPEPPQKKVCKATLRQCHYDKTLVTYITKTKNNGEKYIRLSIPGMENKAMPPLTLAPFLVRYSDLGEDGTLGKKMGKWTVNDPKRAKYSVTLTKGVPDHCKKDAALYVAPQDKCFEWVRTTAQEMMRMAFNDDEVWADAKKSLPQDEEAFVAGANFAFLKTDHDENDDEIEVLKLERRLLDFHGNTQRPVFWKKVAAGTYEPIDPAYIPRHALVIPSISFRTYCFRENGKVKYGVSGDLGGDIVVVWMSKPKTKEELEAEKEAESKKQVQQALSDIPIYDF